MTPSSNATRTHTPTRSVLNAYGRALRSQFNGKMLLLSIIPSLLSLVLWGVLLYMGLQPLIDYVGRLFEQYDLFQVSSSVLSTFGLIALKMVVVPLVALMFLLPIMILTALVFMNVAAMPAIVRHVGTRQFPQLEQKHGGSFLGSVGINALCFVIFVAVWIVTLPLYLFAPLALLVQVLLWGWLTARVMAYDALADYASVDERAIIMRTHRVPLMTIGIVSGALGALPGLAFVGGALAIPLLPLLAVLALWIYVMIFIFTGMWFQYYCMQALHDLRTTGIAPGAT